jgi:hypothetical protein
MWTLILIILTTGNVGSSIDHVPNFGTEDACLTAGKKIGRQISAADKGIGKEYRFECVKQ